MHDSVRHVEADVVFHRELARIGGHRGYEWLVGAVRVPMLNSMLAGVRLAPDMTERSDRFHRRIATAISNGDADAAGSGDAGSYEPRNRISTRGAEEQWPSWNEESNPSSAVGCRTRSHASLSCSWLCLCRLPSVQQFRAKGSVTGQAGSLQRAVAISRIPTTSRWRRFPPIVVVPSEDGDRALIGSGHLSWTHLLGLSPLRGIPKRRFLLP